MESQEKILVFCSREICYLSGNFFAHQLAAAFDDLGYETTVCEFTSQDDLDAVLSPFFGKKCRAVFDFNSFSHNFRYLPLFLFASINRRFS